MANNYTLGRGEIHFGRFKTDTQEPDGERYIGNTPEFNLTIEEEKLEHFSSDRGIREKDDSISLQVNRTGTLVTDNIDPENVALFFFGGKSVLSQTGATVDDFSIEGAMQDRYYQLGQSDDEPTGVRDLDDYEAAVPEDPGPPLVPAVPAVHILVTDDASPTPNEFDEGDDYTIDMTLGRLYIVPGGGIADGTDLIVHYKTKTVDRERVISGSQPVEGSLRFIAKNPKGKNLDYYMPWVQISPNGDYALKGDEWQSIPFNIEVLKRPDREAIYVDGRPFTPS